MGIVLWRLVMIFLLIACISGVRASPVSPEPYVDLECSIYPSCDQYGEGVWQILEDCHKYINCTRPSPGAPLEQHNMECPGDLVFANEYNECVEWDKATDCKVFQDMPCLLSCPRVILDSIEGPADEFQARRIGCFRLSGTIFGGTMVHYQNSNRQYLTPDSNSNPLKIHWIVSESPGAFNGGVRNERFDYIKCPFTDWNQGWEVDTGLGTWVEDTTMHVRCHKGDESASTDWTPVPTSGLPSTAPQSPCHSDGPNPLGDCSQDFVCCNYDSSSNSWNERKCSCSYDFVFDQDYLFCSFMCGLNEDDIIGSPRDSYTCEDGLGCAGVF